jgi:murein DD-endopeptidase MepM/ murein hydrolase activator NlpD
MFAIVARTLAALALLFVPSTAPPAVTPAPTHGVWPLHPRPEVVRGFEPPTTPWGPGHRGVDLLGRSGQRVHSAEAGTVTFAGTLAGRGVVVVATAADEAATRTTYEPVAARVRVGEVVRADQVLGTLRAFGSHCVPRACLHWGLIRGASTYLDPLTLVGAAPVRLLPLTGPPPVAVPSLPVLTPAGVPAGRPAATAPW